MSNYIKEWFRHVNMRFSRGYYGLTNANEFYYYIRTISEGTNRTLFSRNFVDNITRLTSALLTIFITLFLYVVPTSMIVIRES
jgi:hypothetical protein